MEFIKTVSRNRRCVRIVVTVAGQKFSSPHEDHSNTYITIPRSSLYPHNQSCYRHMKTDSATYCKYTCHCAGCDACGTMSIVVTPQHVMLEAQ